MAAKGVYADGHSLRQSYTILSGAGEKFDKAWIGTGGCSLYVTVDVLTETMNDTPAFVFRSFMGPI